jgi:D-glycero-alpha-D-manno-heptose 1-phosphate guanylyltransferase
MPVGNGVFLDLILEKILNLQLRNIYISLHYQYDLFIKYLSLLSNSGNIIPIIEPRPLGTGGAINYVLNNAHLSSPFFVINGDTLSDINLFEMKNAFDQQNFLAMIGISYLKNISRYGIVKYKRNVAMSFNEKVKQKEGWINNGHYIFSHDFFYRCDNAFSLERDLIPKIIKRHSVGIYKVEHDNFLDMGVPSDYINLLRRY